MMSGPKCIVCHLGIPSHIPDGGGIVRAEQRTESTATPVVATNETVVALFHEGCYHAAQPAMTKFLRTLAGR